MTKKVNEISTGDYYKKAHQAKIKAAAGFMFADPNKPETQKAVRDFKNRDAGMKRVAARSEKARAADQQKQMADLVARLPELEAEYADMQKKYKALGGSNWQYADREQNLTDYERKARDMEGPMNNLWRQIQAAKKHQGVAEGKEDKIKQLRQDYATAVHWSKNEKSPQKREAAHQKAEKIKRHLETQYKQGVAEDSLEEYGDTAKGQKMLTKVQKRAVDRVTSKKADTDPKYAKKNSDTANRAWDRMTDKDLEEDAVDDFLAKGGKITYGKTHKPRKGEKWIGSAHIGAAGGKGTKGSVSGHGANTKKGNKPVVSAEGTVDEWKKSTKAPIRPRNPVAKNANAGIGGGAAGAHKDKKKEAKQGKQKHKKKPELAESATYDRRLNLLLEMKLLKEQFKDLKK